MKKYVNVNDGRVLTEEALREHSSRNYEELAEKWKEEGFYNREEYEKWLRENYLNPDYVELPPYLIHPGAISQNAGTEDVLKAVDWFKRRGIDCELTEIVGAVNEYSRKPDDDLWNQMLEEVFGHR